MVTYKNRYQAKKHACYGDVVVKVCGGYAVMDYGYYYRVWKNTK